jgi:hypothetical protein
MPSSDGDPDLEPSQVHHITQVREVELATPEKTQMDQTLDSLGSVESAIRTLDHITPLNTLAAVQDGLRSSTKKIESTSSRPSKPTVISSQLSWLDKRMSEVDETPEADDLGDVGAFPCYFDSREPIGMQLTRTKTNHGNHSSISVLSIAPNGQAERMVRYK